MIHLCSDFLVQDDSKLNSYICRLILEHKMFFKCFLNIRIQ